MPEHDTEGGTTGHLKDDCMTSLPKPEGPVQYADPSETDKEAPITLSALLFGVLGYTEGEFVAICDDAETFSSTVVAASDAEAQLGTVPATVNTYFSVNPIAGPPRTGEGRGKAEDVTRLAALVVDLDLKSCGDMTVIDAITDELSDILGTRPSARTLSGNGTHAYWSVKDGHGDPAELTTILSRWGRLVKVVAENHGAKADSVFDLPRVLRAPETVNNKDPNRPTQVHTYLDTGTPLALADIDARLIEAGVPGGPGDSDDRAERSKPDSWEFSSETCNYVATMVKGWADAETIEVDKGRHQWLLSQFVRLLCAKRLGCITATDYGAAQGILAAQMAHLCATREPVRHLPWAEVPSAMQFGTDTAATKTDAEASEELGEHKHGDDTPAEANGRTLKWRSGRDIRDDVPEWAWEYGGKGRAQRSTLSLFAGRPGAGKSTAARYFAAGYSNGTLGGCFTGSPQNVAYIASEESIEYMVKPSLRAHGADMSRVHFPHVEVDGKEVRLSSKDDEAALTAALIAKRITVVFVDPMMSAIGSKVDINKNNEARAYLEPWARIARAINGLVIGIVHLTKAPGGDVVAAINGSSAFGEVARSVLAFAKDQQSDEGVRVLSQEKNSAGAEDLALEYKLIPTAVTTDSGRDAEVVQFVITGTSDRRVSDVLQIDPKDRNVAGAGTAMCEVFEIVQLTDVPVSADMIAPGLRMPKDTVGKYLRRLAEAGMIVKVGRGKYTIRSVPETGGSPEK